MKEENEKVKILFTNYVKEEGGQLYINERLEQLTLLKEDVLIFYRAGSRDTSAHFGMMAPLSFDEEIQLFVRKRSGNIFKRLSDWFYGELKEIFTTEKVMVLADSKKASLELASALSMDVTFKTLLDRHLHKYCIDIDQNDITVYIAKSMVNLLEENTMSVANLKEMMLLLKSTREALAFGWKHRY